MRITIFLFFTLFCQLRGSAQVPTWSEDIACIAFTHCAPCHHEGGAGHFELTTYANAYYWREEMRAATQTRFMPPWPPDPAYRSLAHERTLTQNEIDLIAAWVEGGSPQGPIASTPPPPVFSNDAVIADPDITATMEEYVVPPSTSDNYRTFVIPIDNPADGFITGVEVIPGNDRIVHHVLVFQDTTGEARALDDADIEPGYASFGGIGVNSAKLIGIWVPGADPVFTPPGMGIKLLANADLVIQVHYPSTGVSEADQTQVRLQLSTAGSMREIAIDPILEHFWTLTNGPLVIPPNEVRSFHSQFTVPLPGTITAIGPHSHLLGKSMRAYAVLPEGDTIPLIDIPNWDFRWQGLYNFKRPIFLPVGTVLHGEATYDNTTANPDNPNSPPAWVALGEATTDEMMLFYFAYTYGFPSDTNLVVDGSTHAPHYLDCAPTTQVGLNEHGPIALLRAWPSPATDRLFVECEQAQGVLLMRDLSGRTVLQERTSGAITALNVADLARGTYVLQLFSPFTVPRPMKLILE